MRSLLLKSTRHIVFTLALGCPLTGISQTFDGPLGWRSYEVVSIAGGTLPMYLGEVVENIRLFRYDIDAQIWGPIPFQIEERDGGDKLLPDGNGQLDANDELIFMASDAGSPIDSTDWPDHLPGTDQMRYHIVLTDPLTGETAGDVCVLCDPTLPMSEEHYIDYNPVEDRVETELYVLTHGSSGFQEDLTLKNTAGGDDVDFLDRQKLRLKLRMNLGALGKKDVVIKEEMDEDITIIPGILKAHIRTRKKQVQAIVGPIRIVRFLTLEVKFTASFVNDIVYDLPFTTVSTPAYAAWLTGEMAVPEIRQGDITADMKEMRLSTDWSNEAMGMWFFSPQNTEGIRVDGIPDTPISDFVWPGETWTAVIADPGYDGSLTSASVVTAYRLGGVAPGDAQSMYYQDFFWLDFDDTGDGRSYGDTGVFVSGSRIVGKVDFTSSSYYIPENLSVGQADSLFNAHAHPLTVVNREETLQYSRISLDTDPPGLILMVDSVQYTAHQSFDWIQGSIHRLACDSVQGALDSTRYRFDSWSNDRPAQHQYTVPATDENVTADYVVQHRLTVEAIPQASGSVTVSPSQIWHDENTMVGVEAVPVQWYVFFEWSGALQGSQNPDSLRMNTAKRIEAYFGNWAPVVEAPDTTIAFDEDEILFLTFESILGWTSDQNNPDSTLSIDASGGPNLAISVDSTNQTVQISNALPHWYGTDTLVIRVSDPLGAVGIDTVSIRVHSVPDPPGAFSLLLPDSNTVFTTWPDTILFSWEIAVDPDSGGTVMYALEIDTTDRFDSPVFTRIDSLGTEGHALTWPGSYGDALYSWRVEAFDDSGLSRTSSEIRMLQLATVLQQESEPEIPYTFTLDPNYPNPFNSQTTVSFGVPYTVAIRILIYDSAGRRVRTVNRDRITAGYHQVIWDGKNEAGRPVPSGLYFFVFHSEKVRLVRKAMLIR